MANLQAGFARVDVTPPLGIEISGYFVERFASGILDALEASALALRCGDDQAILIALDNLMIDKETMHAYRAAIAERTGVKAEAVFIACSHTHTGPLVGKSELDENKYGEKEYGDYLGRKLCDCAVMAVRDMTDAKMGYAVGCAPHIAFVRRFRMKDGSIRTNPGVNNPDIVAPIGDVDERVNVLRFVRKCAPDIVIANFGVHPDVVGGDEISADFPRFVRETTEAALDYGVLRDIYLVIGDPQENGGWAVRGYWKPFANWIWLGSILMAAGGLLSLSDRRWRVASGARRAQAVAAE